MEYNKAIADMVSGDEVEGYYVLAGAQIKRTAAGKPYLSAALSDASGVIDAKMWDYVGEFSEADTGSVIKIRGEVSEYKGTPQLTISRIRPVDDNDRYDLTDLVPSAPIDTNAAYSDICALVQSMGDADYKAVCAAMLERRGDKFRIIPAAKSVHHGFVAGLLMHTANMLQLADFLAAQYSYVIDRDLLLAGTLLHDFAKLDEFTFSKLGLVTGYSTGGQLLGHLVMGAQEVASLAKELGIDEEKSVLLQHMILSHHGVPENGAAVKPMCAESELLSYIDLIDSRMEIFAETFENLPAGSFSPKIYSLDKKIYKHG